MADYSAFEAVLASAIPQLFGNKFPGEEFTRTVTVTDAAKQDYVIKRTTVQVAPHALDGDINLLDFCTRIAYACRHYDTRAEAEGKAILDEFNRKMQHNFHEIERRFGRETLESLITANLNGGPHHE